LRLKGKRNGLEIAWSDLVNGDAAMAVALRLNYGKADVTRWRDLGFDERWLRECIAEDPSLLGLGDLSVIAREHSQPSCGSFQASCRLSFAV
jgi:hypothetical protein